MSTIEAAEAAWLTYRDEYLRANPWCDQRRAARQMRKRDFIAGYHAALTTTPAPTPAHPSEEADRG